MPKDNKKPKFRLLSAVFATVCIILVGDAVAPTASIGNSQYFWWAITLLGFFVLSWEPNILPKGACIPGSKRPSAKNGLDVLLGTIG